MNEVYYITYVTGYDAQNNPIYHHPLYFYTKKSFAETQCEFLNKNECAFHEYIVMALEQSPNEIKYLVHLETLRSSVTTIKKNNSSNS